MFFQLWEHFAKKMCTSGHTFFSLGTTKVKRFKKGGEAGGLQERSLQDQILQDKAKGENTRKGSLKGVRKFFFTSCSVL